MVVVVVVVVVVIVITGQDPVACSGNRAKFGMVFAQPLATVRLELYALTCQDTRSDANLFLSHIH